MTDLSERKLLILKAITLEYINTALPVGSETLEKKYQIPASPATIRNEMVQLTQMGYLKKPHKSAGRSPTPLALKYYVRNILKVEQLPVSEEVSYKEHMWDVRNERQKLLLEAVKTLSDRTNNLSLVTTNEGELYYYGASHILDYPEFYDIDLTKTVLQFLDRSSFWQDMSHKPVTDEPFYIVLGEEFGDDSFGSCGFLYAKFTTPTTGGIIGVVGPYRLEYSRLIPSVICVAHLLSDLGK